MFDDQEVELCIGDVLRVGHYSVTVVDIDDDEVSFRVDTGGSDEVVEIGLPR